jgi:phosphoribosyl 1,2-cyclic phosphodiesterase
VLRFCCLGSGSAGNAWVVESTDGLFATRVLIDNGFNSAQLARRLARVGLALEQIDALVLTHEHSDHVGGVAALLKRRPMAVLASAGTARAAQLDTVPTWRRVRAGDDIDVGALQLRPFAVPHDAAEPVHFVVSDGVRRLGIVTDIGAPAASVAAALGGVDALVLECNHESDLLLGGAYPPFLKQRIGGELGHLSNSDAAQLLAQVRHRALRHVVAAHLSRSNNRPDLARKALAGALGCEPHDVQVADQDTGLDWVDV